MKTESMELPQDFHIDLLFPDDHSDFIAEVYFKDRLVLVIDQEKGPNELEVEFSPDLRGLPERMPLNGLEDAIVCAKHRLRELQNEK